MTAMPTRDRRAVTTPETMQVQYQYPESPALSPSVKYPGERRATSPGGQIDIFSGGWDDDPNDDDDEDYVDMAPVVPQRGRSATHSPSIPRLNSQFSEAAPPNRINELRQLTPSVIILPASPHGSIASNSSLRTTSRSPSPAPSTDDSESSSDSESDPDYAEESDDSIKEEIRDSVQTKPVEVVDKTKRVSRTSIPSADVGLVLKSPPPHPRRQPSVAGQAARKYLQMQSASKSSALRSQQNDSPTGLQRSSSRVGTRGVQNRIGKSRQSYVRSQSVEDLEENEARINEAKQKSRTLDRSLSGVKQTVGLDEDEPGDTNDDVSDDEKRKSNDGAAVMKMIAHRRRTPSQSLDSKYLQYLGGIAKYASAPNSPKTAHEDKKRKSKKKSKKNSKEVIDDEAEFRKFAEIMANKTRTSCTSSSPDLSIISNESVESSLAEFAKQKAKADKLVKKRSGSGGFASKLSFRKSKTIGKAGAETSGNTFAESAQAFHEQLKRGNSLETPVSIPNDVDVESKSDSFKKEKRKSWRKRHGLSIRSRSKEKLNSGPSSPATSPPMTPNDLLQEDVSGKSAGPPQIKQSLGYQANQSPSLKLKSSSIQRQRTTSIDNLDTPSNSPKIRSPGTSRSLTLDNRKRGTGGGVLVRTDSNGQIGIHAKLRQVNSLNSENSGSNSDISILDDEFDENKVGKAGTLSRLLGRKMKAGKMDGADFDETQTDNGPYYGSLGRRRTKRGKYATLGSPVMTLRMRHANSRELFLETEPLDPIDRFFRPSRFVRGFRVNSGVDEEDDDELYVNALGLTFEAAGVNKYATITGARSSPYLNYDTKSPKKRESLDNTRQVNDESPSLHRRNKSLPGTEAPTKLRLSKGKGFGAALSRTLQRGSTDQTSHLAFNDILTEHDIADGPLDRLATSPLRTRKVQAIDPLLETPSPKVLSAARTLYCRLATTRPDLLQPRCVADERDGLYEANVPESEIALSYQNTVFGQELVTWLVEEMPTGSQESSESSSTGTEIRRAACSILQVLLEEGALSHVRREHHFQDSYLLYQFHESVTNHAENRLNGRPVSVESTISSSTLSSDIQSTTSVDTTDTQNENESRRDSTTPSLRSFQTAPSSDKWVPAIVDEQELKEVLSYLQNVAPDARLRMILRKLPEDRTAEELMMIYEEILHIKALAHLSDSVKRELAGVLKFEFHRKGGKTLFSQGDEGRSWYIIIKGSVDVDIQGQGVVCTLHEGDDFGNLAIINDAPRAATIVLAEDNCQLLRVDKHDFVRILKDVEANTVRLKEHEKDVLILQKIHARSSSTSGRQEKFLNNNTKANQRVPVAATPTRNNHRYAISAGTPAKIVEHVIKSLRPWSTAKLSDEAMEDLILMYQVFMTTQELCKYLMNLYHSEKSEQIDSTKSIKRKVVYFVVRWSHIATHIFYDQPAIGPFLKELKQAVTDDGKVYPNLKEDLTRIYVEETGSADSPTHRGWITVESSTAQRYPTSESSRSPHKAIKATDDVMLKVYTSNATYTTVRLPVISTVTEIISAVAEKQGREAADLSLIQVQSDGDMYVLPKKMTSAATSLGVNSRLFICSTSEKDDIAPLAEQTILPTNNNTVLEMIGSQEIAEHITQYDWELINSIHVMEFVHKVFGSHKFHSVTSNIDIFARRFNQLAYWAPTEICSCNNVNKRVHLLRKFIKIAQHLKELQNMNAFMAVMIGLGNQALSRLHGTWDKLPTKYKKLMSEFEAVLDPSRNHRAYRLYVAGLRPPMIPYLPLLMKDMTFQHEGNDSTRNGLTNFEKMHMMSNSIRGVIQACCKPLEMSHTVITSKNFDETRQYSRNFSVVTDQKLLNHLSGKVESKR